MFAAGLYHPNCKDHHSTYFPGLDDKPKPMTKEEKKNIVDGYNKQQKLNYCEKQEKFCDRCAKFSLDEDNQKIYDKRKKVFSKNIVNTRESGIIDIEVDEKTPCLRRLVDNKIVATNVNKIVPTKDEFNEWEFDWSKPTKDGFSVYKLKAVGDDRTQGLIALKQDNANSAINVGIVESAPFNNSHNKKFKKKEYAGVGAHLFAEAVKQSYKCGFDGYVYFVSKTNLVDYYTKVLGADLINATSRTMVINEQSAKKLFDRYYGGGK